MHSSTVQYLYTIIFQFWHLFVALFMRFADRKTHLKMDVEVTVERAEQYDAFCTACNDHQTQFAEEWQGIEIEYEDDSTDLMTCIARRVTLRWFEKQRRNLIHGIKEG